MKERICLICGRTYVKVIGVSFAKYCSEECRRKAGKLQGKIRHKLKYKSKRKQYKPIRCIICGSEFMPLQRTSKYCSNRCKRKASAQIKVIKIFVVKNVDKIRSSCIERIANIG